MFATVDPGSSATPAPRVADGSDGPDDVARPAVDPADPSVPLSDRKAAAAFVASVCFKHGPPRLIGTELEWLVRDADRPARRLDPAVLLRALGPHAPTTLRPDAPESPAPLPGGGTVTVEPGGQVEIASPPMASLPALLQAVQGDVRTLRDRLAAEGLVLQRRAGDALRAPRRVLDVPRYASMEAAFDRIGPHGRTMMCSTASVQVCLDAGEGADVARRWAALHELGPVLCAAFANSPAVHGRWTGWKSSRMATWLSLDPARTRPPSVSGPDPAAEYAERALATPLLSSPRGVDGLVPLAFGDWIDGAPGGRDAGCPRPTPADLAYHLTTLFPPVRPQGHLEVRYLDQQPDDEWMVPIAVVAALFADPATVDRARAAAAPAVGRWSAAARHGLDDRVLRRAAGELFELAHRALRTPPFAGLDPAVLELVDRVITDRVLRGRCPADDPLGEPGEAALGPPGASWLAMDPPVPPPAPHPTVPETESSRGGDPT